MKNFGRVFEAIVKYAVYVLAIIFATMLFAFSIKGTAYLDLMEHVAFGTDNVLKNIVICIAVALLFFFLRYFKGFSFLERKLERKKTYYVVFFVLFAVLIAETIIWTASSNFFVWADAAQVHDAATNFINGVYSDFAPGGYIDVYPLQTRMLVFWVIIDKIFGGFSVKLYTIINAVSFIALWLGIYKTVSILTKKRICRLAVLLVAIVWLPPLFYISFLYGNIISMAFLSWAIYCWMAFWNHHKLWHSILAALFISIAFCFKGLAVIPLIAMAIYGIGKLFSDKENAVKNCLAYIILAVVFACAIYIPKAFFTAKTGFVLDQGLPVNTMIEMGIRDDGPAPGWYIDASKNNYANAGFTKKGAGEISHYYILGRVADFKANPKATINFFVRKIKSVWNEPTFQSFWILRDDPATRSKLMNSLLEGKAGRLVKFTDEVFSMLIWLGCLFILVMKFRKKDFSDIILPMSFAGGFLFQILWEGKAQYSMYFFVLLIPFVLAGLGSALSRNFDKQKNLDL